MRKKKRKIKEKSKGDFGEEKRDSWFFTQERETREREREKRKGVPLFSTIYEDRVVGYRRAKT